MLPCHVDCPVYFLVTVVVVVVVVVVMVVVELPPPLAAASSFFSQAMSSATPLIISLTRVTSSLPMRSTLDTSRMPSSLAALAKPPEPRACNFRSASHFLKFGCFEAFGILIIMDARRPVPQFDGQERMLPYISEISSLRSTPLQAVSTAFTRSAKRSNTARML